MTPIRPEILAGRLHQIGYDAPALAEEIRRQPRFLELLWFVQWQSMQPGGLERFAEQVIEKVPDRFMSEGQLKAGRPKDNGRYTMAQCLDVWKLELEEDRIVVLGGTSFSDWACLNFDPNLTADPVRWTKAYRKEIQAGMERFGYDYFYGTWQKQALQGLINDLASLRNGEVERLWDAEELRCALLEFMDWHCQEVRKQIADTRITKTVFDELDFSLESKVPVPIVGESRLGKTTSVAAWCQMRPGAARLVTVPESNRERELYAAHADAFGLDCTRTTPTSRLKADVEFICRHSGLFLVYDEAHFLVPQNYSRTTPPQRLNWVRCQVIDRGLGCAFLRPRNLTAKASTSSARPPGIRCNNG